MATIRSMFRKLFDHPTERQNQKPLKNNTDTYLTAEQRCAKIQRDQASIARSDDAALAAAMQASLIELDTVAEKKQAQAHAYFNESNRANSTRTDQRPKPSKADFLSQEQIFAMEAGDAQSIKEANEQALAKGMQISAAEVKHGSSTPMRSGRNLRSIPEPEYAGHRAATEKLRAWFTAHHFRVIQNLGENSNCLLISLLQHATGDYQSEHTRAANDYKALLASQSNGANRFSDGLFENTTLIARLIDQINADYGSDISAQFYVGNSSDEPGIHTVGTGKRPVIIFDQFGHFEAVVPLEKQ